MSVYRNNLKNRDVGQEGPQNVNSETNPTQSKFGIYRQKPLSIIIMGYGGRAQWLLMKCLEQRGDITIVAICDDKAKECLDHMQSECDGYYRGLKEIYGAAIAQIELYPDSLEGMRSMFEKHPNVDMIWITSRNDRHFAHLSNVLQYSSCQKIFMEKPLFRTLDELRDFDWDLVGGRDIVIGLTLRYSSMAVIVAEQLQAYREQLGALRQVKAWERLGFSHALHSFVLGNRRYRSMWGGLLLEKSIHDIDLALFFISATGFNPSRMTLDTIAENRFFTRSNQLQILEYCGDDYQLKKRVEKVLSDYPLTGEFNYNDLIPDYHRFSAHLFAEGYDPIEFEVETDMSSHREAMERGILLNFERGQILVDIMASCMIISLNDGTSSAYDLHTCYGGHADGDIYVIHAILNDKMPDNHLRVTVLDPIVQLANRIALVSEAQAASFMLE